MAPAATSTSPSPTPAPSASSAPPRPSPPCRSGCSPALTPNSDNGSTPIWPPLEVEHKIHTKSTVRHPRDRADLLAQDRRLGPRRAQRPEASRLRHLARESCSRGAGHERLNDRNLQAKRAHRPQPTRHINPRRALSRPRRPGRQSGDCGSTPNWARSARAELERFADGLTTQEVATLMTSGNDAPDRAAAA